MRERDSNRIYRSNSEQLNSDNIDINSMGGNSYTTDSNLDKSNSNENISDVSNLGDSDSNHLCQSNPNKTNSKLNASYSSNSVSGTSNLGDSDSNHSVYSYQSEEEDSQQISDTGGLEENINIQFKEYREGLSIYYTNADSVLNKLDELKVRIQIISPDILIITEIFPKTGKACDIAVEELHIDNYTLYTSSIKDNSRGVAIYVVNSLSSTLNLNLTEYSYSESVWVNIRLENRDSLLIGGIYRSPQSSDENNKLLFDLLNKLKEETYSNIIIMGDFNMPEINWELWTTSRSENHHSYRFLECLRDSFLEQPITHPTRWVNDTSWKCFGSLFD